MDCCACISLSLGEGGGQGPRFFEGLLNSRHLTQLRAKLELLESHYRGEPETEANRGRALLFKTLSRWLTDPLVLDKNLHVASLSPIYMPRRLAGLIGGEKV